MKKWIVFVLSFLFATGAQAELKIDISGAQSNPIPIAVADFTGTSYGSDIREVIVQDLEQSGLFRIIHPDAYIQKMENVNQTPRFSDWQAVNAQALLYGSVERTDDQRLRVSFRLWDVFAGQSMEAKALTLPVQDWRRLAHMIADMVYSRVTGESGYFDTQVVYVAESGPARKRVKRLAVMDQDGANHRYLTDGKAMVLTPRFAPNMQKIAYMSFKGGKPQIYMMNLNTGREEYLGSFPGMTFAPRFSPDSKELLLSLAQNGNSEIYLYHVDDGQKTRLTNHPAIDTSPSFSPDGRQIVFSSDRSGSQQLYVMDRDGKNVKRISFGSKGTYATPVWSPRGDYIAFTKIQGGTFYIGVMRPDGSGERLITQGFLVEGPSWAPNGRVLMYFKQLPYTQDGERGQTGLYSIDITGYNERFIRTPGEASDPAWSPLLH